MWSSIFLPQLCVWGISDEVYIQKVCRLLVYHTIRIPDFKIHTCTAVVSCSGCSCCHDRISAVQLFLCITIGGVYYEYHEKEKTAWFSCFLHRLRNTMCRHGSYNRLGFIFGDMPYMCRIVSYKVLKGMNKKVKKRVSAPLITLLSELYLILSI